MWVDGSDSVDDVEENYKWLISADKIFSSGIKDFKDFSMISDIEFEIREYSIVDGPKFSDSVIQAKDVIITMPIGRYCAILQSRLAERKVISKILIKRVVKVNKELMVCEDLTFEKATIQSFVLHRKSATFSFRYEAYSYGCTDLKLDGTKLGTSAVTVNAKWEVKEK